jgi:hypothetical protein
MLPGRSLQPRLQVAVRRRPRRRQHTLAAEAREACLPVCLPMQRLYIQW